MVHGKRRWLGLATLAAASLALSGCDDDPTCEPGATMPCECPGGVAAVRSCLEDGQLWGACECDGTGGSGGTGASTTTSSTGGSGGAGDGGTGAVGGAGGAGGTHAGGAPSGSGG